MFFYIFFCLKPAVHKQVRKLIRSRYLSYRVSHDREFLTTGSIWSCEFARNWFDLKIISVIQIHYFCDFFNEIHNFVQIPFLFIPYEMFYFFLKFSIIFASISSFLDSISMVSIYIYSQKHL